MLSPSRRHPKYHSVALLQEKTRRVPATLSIFVCMTSWVTAAALRAVWCACHDTITDGRLDNRRRSQTRRSHVGSNLSSSMRRRRRVGFQVSSFGTWPTTGIRLWLSSSTPYLVTSRTASAASAGLRMVSRMPVIRAVRIDFEHQLIAQHPAARCTLISTHASTDRETWTDDCMDRAYCGLKLAWLKPT